MTQELNCSDAAKMLIERMATHPDEFKTGERFWRVMQIINGESDMGFEPVMSKRDIEALTTAAQQLFEASFMEYVLHKLLVKDEESRLGRASPQKGKITNMAHPSQMAQQGSSLHPDLKYPASNPYQNMYPTGGLFK